MPQPRISTVLTLSLLLLACPTCWGQVTWDGGGDGISWEDNCNWTGPNCGFQPFDGDPVLIPANTSPFPKIRFPEGILTLDVQTATGIDLQGALTVHNSVSNSGSIVLTNNGQFQIHAGSLSGVGEVVLADSIGTFGALTGAGHPNDCCVTHAADHTIRGEGAVQGQWINHGLIRAEETSGDSTATLHITGTMTNHGVIRSSATGAIRLQGALTIAAGGQFIADQTSIELASLSSVTGGTLQAINGAKFVHNAGPMNLSGVTINSDFDVLVNNGGVTVGGTGITNNGTMTIDNLDVANGQLHMNAGSTLDGSGQVILNRANQFTFISGNFEHGANHTIRGSGRIQATIDNHGTILAEPRNGNVLRVVNGRITNHDLLQANSGSTLRLEQESIVTQSAAGRIRAQNDSTVELLHNTSIIGGTLQTEGTGLIVSPSGQNNFLTDVTNEGNLHVVAGFSSLRIRGTSLTNHGTITVNPDGVVGITGLEFGSNVTLQGTGTIVLNQTGNNARISNLTGTEIITQAAGHTIRGPGYIDNGFGSGMFVNRGRLEGNSAAEPLVIRSHLSGDGTLKDVSIISAIHKQHILGDVGTTAIVHAEGLYSMGNNVGLLVDLAGTTPGTGYDQLNSTGPISLSSTQTRLEVSVINGFVPSPGDTFTVVTTTNSLTGTFGTAVLPANIPNYALAWAPVQYTGQEVILKVLSVDPRLGDFDGNGLYECADVDALSEVIAGGSHVSLFDITGDGLVTTADLTMWLGEAGATNLASGNPYLAGDANLDGAVDGSDFGIWNSNKFTATTGWCSGNFNADGFVDGSDFGLWNANKFTSADAQAVPEPHTTAIVLLLAYCMAHSLRRA